MNDATPPDSQAWPDDIYKTLSAFGVRQVSFVPDGGHARLIARVQADPDMQAISLTTEEEGIAQCAGAWLGGDRSALLMQSSGVGNCINMLSMIEICRMPLLMLITMRGEWGEFNSWQVPMGTRTEAALKMSGIHCIRAERAEDVADTVRHAASMAFDGGSALAVLLAQRLIGAKVFVEGGTAI